MINEFIVEAVDLGDLEKIRIGHDNAGEGRQGENEPSLTSPVNYVAHFPQ